MISFAADIEYVKKVTLVPLRTHLKKITAFYYLRVFEPHYYPLTAGCGLETLKII